MDKPSAARQEGVNHSLTAATPHCTPCRRWQAAETVQSGGQLLLSELTRFLSEVMDRDAEEKELLQEGGSQAVPVYSDRTGVIEYPGVPGVDGRRNTHAVNANMFQKYCIEGVVAILGSMLLGVVFYCAISLWRKRKHETQSQRAREQSQQHPSEPMSERETKKANQPAS
ncbi:uncharacterized protein O9250_012947 [Rhynochetos jubatus]